MIDSAFITSDYNKGKYPDEMGDLEGVYTDLGVYSTSLTLGLLNEEIAKVEASAIGRKDR